MVVAAIISGIYFYIHFPERVITHWNFAGQPDGYSGRAGGAFSIPAMLAFMYGLFLFFPMIDPKKDRYAEFEKYFRIFRSVIIGFLLVIFLVMGASNLGFIVNIGPVVAGIVGLLMMILGNYMGKIKNNWFMGIRNPWTLLSENVWNKTHRFGGRMFILFGLVIIIAPYLPPTLAFILFASGVGMVVFGTMVYSYWLYSKEKKQ